MQIKNYVKRIVVLLICAVLLCEPQLEVLAVESQDMIPEGFVLAAENDQLQMYYSKEKAQIKVRNKKTGYVWDSALPDEQIPEDATGIQREEMRSLFTFTYSTATYFSTETTECSLESEEYTIQTEKISDGFAYIIYIPEFDVQIRTEYVLNAYGMEARVPENGIQENLESGTKVSQLSQELLELLNAKREQFVKIQEEEKLDREANSKLDKAIETLDEMTEVLGETTSPFGISAISDELAKKLDVVFDNVLGAGGEKGIYTVLLESSEVDEATKTKYRQELQLLQGANLSIKIRIAQMKEVPAITFVNMKLLPYFGATGDDQEGYMLYPNGSGALTYFKKEHGSFASMYEADTYSSLSPDLDWEEGKNAFGLSNIAIPYFGVKVEDDAFIAYVSSGSEMSTIRFAPSGYIIPVNRIGAAFHYRQTIATTSVAGEWQTSADVMIYERNIRNYQAAIQYQFLENENANYSGMANVLRGYLLEQDILAKSELIDTEVLPLALDIFGGYKEKILVFDKYVVGTTVEQAKTIMESFDSVPILCNYRGMFKEGFDTYPSSYELASQLGSESEMGELAQQIQENGGMLFLESNQLAADYDQSGYTDGELAIGNQFLILDNVDSTKYLLSQEKITERHNNVILPQMGKYGCAGLTETLMGSFVYADYSEKHESTRTETVEVYQNIFRETKETLGSLAVNEGSDYTFSQADWLRNVPTDVSGYIYTDEAVPFYMLLVHGYIPYTALANNQFYNAQEQTLKAIEYGQIPYFSLSYEEIALGSTGAYVSTFSAIYEDIIETYNLYSEALGDLVAIPIVAHERDGAIAITEYENGTKIIVNYGKTEETVDGITVAPMSFAKTQEGEVKKIEPKEIAIIEKDESKGVPVYNSLVIGLSVLLFVSLIVFGGFGFFYRHRH